VGRICMFIVLFFGYTHSVFRQSVADFTSPVLFARLARRVFRPVIYAHMEKHLPKCFAWNLVYCSTPVISGFALAVRAAMINGAPLPSTPFPLHQVNSTSQPKHQQCQRKTKRRAGFSAMNATQGSEVHLHQTEQPNALPLVELFRSKWERPPQIKEWPSHC